MAAKRGGRGRRGGRGGYVVAVVVLVIAVVVLVLVLSHVDRGPKQEIAAPPPPKPDTTALPPSRSVVLFFGKEDADGLFRELREVRARDAVDDGARAVIEELIRGPAKEGVPSIPKEARLRKVFFDERSATLYLDFSKEFQTEHWGGSEGELLTVRSILRSVAANFPAVKAVQLLVEGKEIETIAGHVDTSQPFDLADFLREDREGPEGKVFGEQAP